jgi:carbon storage regulator
MLVITRRVGEEIVIDGNIRVTVVAARGRQVRLGISAPNSIPVDRKEIFDRRFKANGRHEEPAASAPPAANAIDGHSQEGREESAWEAQAVTLR